ncbi:MAG: tRNA (adenosine(37)-N6)-threonylcarbamoyltransferase complex ATPase subunit type 1 TsaE [Rhodobacteraceae bacterium]|nr:tRNA (adenosine(37)-N6)-threonylcarbamoyltransferase complex ATPase subunit type 1 TsaE [Paracoccaceae bacterium]
MPASHILLLPDLDRTQRLAAEAAKTAVAGDCFLLEGPVGAGKTAFSRAFVQAALGRAEDVPSPTFTLVQTYETPTFEIWHCDLYRLTSADELIELGLEDAFTSAVTLIEWPDRLGDMAPTNAQRLSFEVVDEDVRRLSIHGDARWAKRGATA